MLDTAHAIAFQGTFVEALILMPSLSYDRCRVILRIGRALMRNHDTNPATGTATISAIHIDCSMSG